MTLTVRRNAPIKTAADTATSNRSHGASRRTPVSGLVYATDKRAHMPRSALLVLRRLALCHGGEVYFEGSAGWECGLRGARYSDSHERATQTGLPLGRCACSRRRSKDWR